MNPTYFYPADSLLPNPQADRTLFSVVACDQYTSQPDYWARVQERTASVPSAYHLVFPELYLNDGDFDSRITSINQHMRDYLDSGLFTEYPNSLLYVERTLKNGAVRKGIVGAIDLEQYDYQKGSKNYIRATEGTVLERIPPRVKIREHAPLELPHVMLLIDDDQKTVIEPLHDAAEHFELLYDFPLMEDSGHLRGWKIDAAHTEAITELLNAQSDPAAFNQKYGTTGQAPMLFAVGDGNHSLATAKACYEAIKQTLPPEEAKAHPARYALVELVNLHDASLEFEAIHRVLFGVNAEHLLQKLAEQYKIKEGAIAGAQTITAVIGSTAKTLSILNPDFNLAVGTLQHFLDGYLKEFGGRVDYIHGEDVVYDLCRDEHNMGFILPCMDKSDLFKTVILDGALPRKTFSMGEACDKRFYLEARKIR